MGFGYILWHIDAGNLRFDRYLTSRFPFASLEAEDLILLAVVCLSSRIVWVI